MTMTLSMMEPTKFRSLIISESIAPSVGSVYELEGEIEEGVAHTARWAAALRAIEQEHPQALITDPLARKFAGEVAMQKVRPDMEKIIAASGTHCHSHIAIRARAFDDMIQEEIREESELHASEVQVVNLGAGMCTRAWRLANLSATTSWYEVDRPDSIMLRRKLLDSIESQSFALQPRVDEYYTVPLDLSESNQHLSHQLRKQRFDSDLPTIVIMEGLLMYLTVPEIKELATELQQLSRGPTCIMASVINDGFLMELQNPGADREEKYPSTGQVKDLFVSSWESGTREAFKDAGWRVDFVMARELFAQTFLNCDMLQYPFPDRNTSTELFVVMRRDRKEGFQSVMESFFKSIACHAPNCRP